jgi:hypothetical protein
MANTQEGIADTTVREVSQWAVDHAPCITFAQVRALAIKQGLNHTRSSGAIPGGGGAPP